MRRLDNIRYCQGCKGKVWPHYRLGFRCVSCYPHFHQAALKKKSAPTPYSPETRRDYLLKIASGEL